MLILQFLYKYVHSLLRGHKLIIIVVAIAYVLQKRNCKICPKLTTYRSVKTFIIILTDEQCNILPTRVKYMLVV